MIRGGDGGTVDTLSRFRIVRELGAGGMGRVFLAEDTRLRRSVALKVLPPELAENPDRLRRFEEEACAASALSHPNILVVYETGEDRGLHYIATEYVDGVTLRRRMAAGPLPVAEALEMAIQVASALSAAHEAGVVHRDVKPENVIVRGDGYVKVVDFGLARPGPADTVGDQGHTRTDTEPGKVMGTVDYMSPEQARGLPVDERTDVFSLGSVLYEALAGRKPFTGETRSDVLAALLATEAPPLPEHVGAASAELPWVVSRMLRKGREERYQTAREVVADLKRARRALDLAVLARSLPATSPTTPRRGHAVRRLALAMVGASIVLAAGAWWMSQPSSWPVSRVAVAEPRLGELVRYDARTAAWSPFLSGMSAHHVAFSPDGRWIAYVDYPEATLCRSRPDGSGRTQLTFPPFRAATPSWSPDGTRIAFVGSFPEGRWKVHVVSPDRSPPRPLLSGDREERTPGWSPDGRKLVFWVLSDEKKGRIRVLDLSTGVESAVPGSESRYSARWSPDGRRLLALSFADNGLSVLDLESSRWTDLAGPHVSWPHWSRDGRHVYYQTMKGDAVFRVRIADSTVERWASLEDLPRLPRLEPFGQWLGLGPDDAPLVLSRWHGGVTERIVSRPAP